MDKAVETAGPVPRSLIVTASYAADLERCRLLCETIDRHVTGFDRHLLLVEQGDVGLFRQLESRTRMVVDERDILPSWLGCYRDPFSLFRRRIWLGRRVMPLRGWHVQQLRRIAIAAHVDEDALVYCDSDVAFVRPFDCAAFWNEGRLRLFRRDGVLVDDPEIPQMRWSRNAGKALGIREPSGHDYITTLIAWRREAVLAMCRHIEEPHGRHWIETVASTRQFSECMLYGRHADEIMQGAGHFHDGHELCRMHWKGSPLSREQLAAFIAEMDPGQVAIGMQSFIGTDLAGIRQLVSG